MKKKILITTVLGGTDAVSFLTAVTTGAQTLTLTDLTVAAGKTVTIDWGDGNKNTYTAGSAARTHDYAGAGTWAVKMTGAQNVSAINLSDTKIVFNSSFFKSCGDALTSVTIEINSAGQTINSADMSHLKLSGTLSLYFPQAGTYTINSSHFASYTLSSVLYLLFTQAGTYTINSSHFASYTLSSILYLLFTQAGTYTINSSHFASYTLSGILYLIFTEAGTYTINSSHFASYPLSGQLYLVFPSSGVTTTFDRADFDGFPALPTVRIEMGLSQAHVDAVLFGFYDGFATKTVDNGTIDLLGQGNAAPTGTATGSAEDPPTTGWNAAYELVNDSGGISLKHWASVTCQT